MKPTERVLKVVNNGIYERRVVEREQRPTDWKALEQAMRDAILSDNTFLDQVRDVVCRVLADHGIATDGGLPHFEYVGRQGGKVVSRTPDELGDLPEIVRDACALLCKLHGQESSYSASLIFNAGRLFERMQVRQFEPLAAIGKRRRRSADDARKEASKKSKENRQELLDAIRAELASMKRPNKSQAFRNVAGDERFCTTFEALEQLWYRHGDKPKKRRPKK